jgi:hypothetical protein
MLLFSSLSVVSMVLLYFVILIVSFPVYVKVVHFVFWRCGSVFSFCSCCGGAFSDSVYVVFIVV